MGAVEKHKVLIVEDEAGVRFGLRAFLEAQGYDVEEASTCAEAQELFHATRPDAAILDFMLPDGNALELLPRLKAADPGVAVVILTAHGSIDLAVKAIKEGADQFLTKPVELPALLLILQRALENQRNRQQRLAGKSRRDRDQIDPFLGKSAAIRELAERARRVLATASPIVIHGETGTGKGVLAAWLHGNGARSEEPFVDLNCATLSREFLETELFGHEKGAFTGAAGAKAGLLEVAHRGTLFLDEIGDVDPQVQPKLLKVLEEKRFRRLGDVRDRRVDVQLIAATHQDLGALVREKRFRSDLYFRISTIPLEVPPLRARREDIAQLASHLLEGFAAALGRGATSFSAQAEAALESYPWPGNVRELRNVIERAVLLSEQRVLDRKDLRFDAASIEVSPEDASLTLLEVEQRHIRRVLEDVRGRVDQAAIRLGVPKSTLYEKLKKYGIAVSRS